MITENPTWSDMCPGFWVHIIIMPGVLYVVIENANDVIGILEEIK